MTTLSSKVRIGPFPFSIILDSLNTIDSPGPYTFAQIVYEKLQIIVDRNQPQETLFESLLHEIFHGVFEVSGLKNKISSKTEEEIISSLTPYVVMLFIDNKFLRDMVSELGES